MEEKTNEEVLETPVEETPAEEPKTDWEAKFKESEGKRRRAETKLEKAKTAVSDEAPKEETVVPEKDNKTSSEKDYAKMAYLRSAGIIKLEERELVDKFQKESGYDIDVVLENKFFQSELETLRNEKSVEKATPSSSKRGVPSTQKSSVEYWIAKGELPPKEMGDKLRREYVNRKYEQKKDGNKFTTQPFGG